MSYDALRQFADSWGLVFMAAIFVVALVWVLRPGAGAGYRDQASIPFRHDNED